jgi:hypothetical protein
MLAGSVGCVSMEGLVRGGGGPSESKTITELAVMAECDLAQQDGREIPGLVVQVLLLDESGRPSAADGSMKFSLYRESAGASPRVEPDDQFTFSGEQLRAAAGQSSLGTVHNFWIPRRGKLLDAPRIQLVSVYRDTSGEVSIAQTNSIPSKRPEIKIEEKVDPAIEESPVPQSSTASATADGKVGSVAVAPTVEQGGLASARSAKATSSTMGTITRSARRPLPAGAQAGAIKGTDK